MNLRDSITNYFHTLLNTLTSPRYYIEILNRPLSFSWRFFFISYILLSLLSATLFIALTLPQWRSSLADTSLELQERYPNNLEIRWDNQTKTLSTQPAEPINVPYPSSFPTGGLPEQFARINTQVSSVEDALPESQTSPAPMVVVTKDTIFVSDLNGGWSDLDTEELTSLSDTFVLTKQTLPDFISRGQKFMDQVFLVSQLAYPIIFFFVASLTTLLAILFNSMMVYFFIRLFNTPLPYRKIMQISLHVAVVAELVQICTQRFVQTDQLNMFSLTYWVYIAVVLLILRGVKQIQRVG
jgi:hypothetical protein